MVTSAGPGEGKSTTIANLAVTYAQMDRKVVLIDADMRKPTVHHTFHLSNRWGLSSVIAQQCGCEEVLQKTDIPNLDIISSGVIPPNPAEMLASKRMSVILDQLREQYEVILIDTPPVLAVTDAQLMAAKSDGVILVMESGKVKREIAMKAKASLEQVKARILGAVLNNVKHKQGTDYYYYYGANEG